ncbi:unnamed protein product [Effrenium voratum]|uniref:Ppx/GppA phosphatase domain-containing protein n=1 Tax=Effrenium voratum TaxID=2562239 RepID=A0AA36NDI7_9DINO|nr:unnamed protein product [Effrenium voratum]
MLSLAPPTARTASIVRPSRTSLRFMPEALGLDPGACMVAAGVLSAGAAVAQVPRRAQRLRKRKAVLSPPSRLPDFLRTPLLIPAESEREPTVLVDCGSGSTRALYFQDDGRSHVAWEKSEWRGEPLAKALHCELRVEKLLRLLEKELSQLTAKGPVLLGATAGVRHAVEDGSLPESKLQLFRDRLHETFGPRARFMVLSGQEEARAEWEALQHALDFAPDLSRDHFDGMLSGGGMSCQLVLRRDGSSPDLFSFRNGVLAPAGLADRAGRGELLAEDLAAELDVLQRKAEEQAARLPRVAADGFALVEWLGLFVAGESTERDQVLGMGYERWLSRQEILERVSAHLAKLATQYSPGAGPVPRRAAISLNYGIILRAVLQRCFHAGSRFYCLKGVNWSTGHYLLHREVLEQSALQQV